MSPVSSAPVGRPFDRPSLHPLHAFLLGGATCFLLSGFLSDWAYAASHEIQWKNFAAWLIMGGLVLGGCALLWAVIGLFGTVADRGRRLVDLGLLLAAWVVGVVNELVHAKDAFASMPEALILSAITAVFAIAAAWLGFSTLRRRGL